MPERAAAVDSAEFENEGGLRGLLRRALGRSPLDAVALFVAAGRGRRDPGQCAVSPARPASGADLLGQAAPGRDRAGRRCRAADAARAAGPDRSRSRKRWRVRAPTSSTDIQRELSRRGFYDGPVDGVNGPKTDAAIRDFETAAKLKVTGEPTEDVLRAIQRAPLKTETRAASDARAPDPIAELIAPSPRVIAVQRALNDFGYGRVKATGVYGAETIAAIQKFERDRKLPVTGQISPRLMRELAALTGRPLE